MRSSAFSSELFLPFLESEKSGPQYLRLFRAFQQAILQGVLSPGTRLPASRPLGEALGVSRNTLRAAWEMLLAEGYIETRHGSGSFVSRSLPDQQPTAISDTGENRSARPLPELSALAQRLDQLGSSAHQPNGRLMLPASPCVSSFPWGQWQRHVTMAGRRMKHEPGQSGMGSELLREQIASYLQITRGVRCNARQVMICSGSQQAMYLALQLLVNAGEPVLVEDPGYYGVDGALAAAGAAKISVPADQDGFQLQRGLALAADARVALLTPSRNYPMGYTLSLERRIELLNWAAARGGWIIEDDYDSEIRFDGPPLTSLQGLDGESTVLYTGTFSRILHPSIRLGYLVLPESLIDLFRNARRYIDGGLSLLPQLALAEFMASGQFVSHVRRMRKLYQQRRQLLHQLMANRFGDRLKPEQSDGGMHSVFLLPDGCCDQQICRQGEAAGLGIRPLSLFYSTAEKPQGLVIGFAGFDRPQMEKGIGALAEILRPLLFSSSRSAIP